MSITPINHYALTTGQPGVINEEAYTVLELVGKCGSKVNECVEAVNDINDRMGTSETQYEAVRGLAQQAVRDSAAAQEAADAAQATADSASANASYAANYVNNMTIFAGIPWYDDALQDGGMLTLAFVDFLHSIVSQILNNNRKYYDLTSNGPGNPCNTLKINGYSPTGNIEYGANCVGLVSIELNLFKAISGLSSASILVHYKQHLASAASGATAQGTVFDVETTITLPAEVYSESNPYDPDDFYCNRLCTYNEYNFQL